MPSAAEQSRRKVGDRNADPHRAAAGRAGDRHQPAHALRDLVEARPLGVRPVLAEAGNAGEHDALVDLLERLVIDAEAVLHIGAEVLDHHVGLFDQPLEHREPLRRFQIERHAAFVALKILEVGAFARTARTFAFGEMRRRLDLDDVGAPIGELAHASRARAHARQIEDGKAGKSLGRPGKRHFNAPNSLNRSFRADLPQFGRSCPSGKAAAGASLAAGFIHHLAR